MEERKMYSKVVGVSFNNRQEIIVKLNQGDKLKLIPEPDNPFDSNCQNILTINDESIGNLKKELAAEIAKGQANGWIYEATVTEVTGKDNPQHTNGVNIEIIAKR